MYVCGITVYDYLPHRPRALADRVRHRATLSADRATSVTFVRNITDIDDKIIQRAQQNGEPMAGADGALHPRHARGLRGARHRCRRITNRARPSTSPQIIAMVQALIDKGLRLRRRRTATCCIAVAKFRGLRPAVRQEPRGPARRCARRGRRGQARSARLRAVEGSEAGRAGVGVAVGPGPAGLAHRVLGDVGRLARRRTSTSTAAAWTSCSRTTRTRSRSPCAASG